jgi:hypothetical protein
LSVVRDCIFNVFLPTLHIGGRSTIRNLRTRHVVLTGNHSHNVVRVMRWVGHVARMGNSSGIHMILVGKYERKRPLWKIHL